MCGNIYIYIYIYIYIQRNLLFAYILLADTRKDNDKEYEDHWLGWESYVVGGSISDPSRERGLYAHQYGRIFVRFECYGTYLRVRIALKYCFVVVVV